MLFQELNRGSCKTYFLGCESARRAARLSPEASGTQITIDHLEAAPPYGKLDPEPLRLDPWLLTNLLDRRISSPAPSCDRWIRDGTSSQSAPFPDRLGAARRGARSVEAMSAFNVLDEKRIQLGELDEACILKLGQGWIKVNRNGLVSLVSALGSGWQERMFWLQQDAVEYEGCRIVTQSRIGATIGYVAEHRSR